MGNMDFDRVIMWQIKNIIAQLLQRLQSSNLVGTHCHKIYFMSFIIFLYVIYYIPICHPYIPYMSRDHTIY